MTENTYYESRLSLKGPVLVSGAQMLLQAEMVLVRITHKLYQWQMLSRQRTQLLQLSDEILKDVGISRYDAEKEARRRFWDEPGDS